MPRFISFLFVLMALTISLEYKYHNAFRQLSKKLLPSEFVVPKYCPQRIVFHPSDWIAPILLIAVLSTTTRRFTKEMLLACSLPLFAAISIFVSPWRHFYLLYFHLWQIFTITFLFLAAALLEEEQRKRVFRAVATTLIAVGTFQALVAIAQYFSQHSLGLRWLGEPQFDRLDLKQSSSIAVPDGCLWIVDRWRGIQYATTEIVRATGTLAHTNVLGGFLVMSSLISLDRFATENRKYGVLVVAQLIALTLTFSRAAIFGFGIAFAVWLFVTFNRATIKQIITLIVGSVCLIGFCFQEQIARRGGLVNYNALAKNSDAGRIAYQNVAAKMMKHEPIFGIGFQQFIPRIGGFLPQGANPEEYRGATHNIFLLWGAETGLLSLSCYLALFGSVAWIGWQRRKEPLVGCLLGVFLAFMFIGLCDFYLLVFQSGRLMLFLIAGLIAAHRWREPLRIPA